MDQPDPTPTTGRPIWDLVIEDMVVRDHVGRERYGTPLQAGNGRDALRDAYEEALDLVVYLRQAIEERNGAPVSADVAPDDPEIGMLDEELGAFLADQESENDSIFDLDDLIRRADLIIAGLMECVRSWADPYADWKDDPVPDVVGGEDVGKWIDHSRDAVLRAVERLEAKS